MRWQWGIVVDAELTPQDRRRARFIVGCSAVGALWAWAAALNFLAVSVVMATAAAAGGALLALAIPLAQRGRLSAAALVVTAAMLLTTAVVMVVSGPQSPRLGVAVAAPLLVGAALGARGAFLAGGFLTVVLIGLGWADVGEGQSLVALGDLQPWSATLRVLLGVTALVVVLRLGYDRVHAELRASQTEQRVSAQLVQEQAAALELRVDERTAQLQRQLRAREDLATAMADRLRRPLEKIAVTLGKLSPEIASKREVARARAAAERMSMMTERLLEHARLGTALTTVEVDLDALLLEIIEEQDAPAVDWELGSLPPLRGDHTLLRMALENLIANAIKFSRTRDQPRIEVSWSSTDGALVVRDNGVGFDTRFIDKLFKPFQRLHGNSEFEGVGVGLANVRRIAQSHGGRCWAESVLGEGAAFYLALPQLEERS